MDLSECCEASFDGHDDAALHNGVGLDVDAQIMHRQTSNTEVLFIRTAPVGMRCWRRGDKHQSILVFVGLSNSQLALIHNDMSSTQVDTLS